jgi:hypothetical protein
MDSSRDLIPTEGTSGVAGEQLGRRASGLGAALEIDVGERLPVLVPDGEAGLLLLDRPGGGKRRAPAATARRRGAVYSPYPD